jgi:tripartite-type tricarboxylate transporter receptor subunit TctC
LALVVFASVAGVVAAETYPNRPIHLIVPWPPGGGADMVARLVADRLALGQRVVVENRPGASGTIGLAVAGKAPADGYTLVIGTPNDLAIMPAMRKDLPFDAARDFAAVTLLQSAPHVLVVSPAFEVTSMREFVALVRAKPDQFRCASIGPGSTSHLVCEVLAHELGTRFVHVPYKGTAPALASVVSGETQFAALSPAGIAPMFEAGRVRALMVMGPRRVATLPGVRTAAELGFPRLEYGTWAGLLVPAGTPDPIVARLNDEFIRVLRRPDVVQDFARAGFQVTGSSPEAFSAFIKAEQAKWAKVISETGIKSE